MGKGINWSPDADAKFLLCIVKHSNPKLDFPKLAEEMSKLTGCDVTPSSLQNRYQRIKASAGMKGDGNGKAANDSPAKSQKGGQPPKGRAVHVKKSNKRPSEEDEPEDDAEVKTPGGIKKLKMEDEDD